MVSSSVVGTTPPLQPLASILGVVDVCRLAGDKADADAAPDLLVEIPHGATRTEDFLVLARRLSSQLPAALVDFFHVNTDAGAPELALAVARAFICAEPRRSVAIMRCRIPRTFIDCNRRLDATPLDWKAGKVTPGLMPWITTPEDRELLVGLHESYVRAVTAAAELLGPSGAMLLLHTYAPRSIDVEVDLEVVGHLHQAYQPEVETTWPLRPEVDVIGRGPDGASHAPAAVVGALRPALARLGIVMGDSATYPLHPSTQAWHHVTRRPGRALCLEVRRDLLADPFQPFVEMRIGPDKVTRLAEPIAQALRSFWQ